MSKSNFTKEDEPSVRLLVKSQKMKVIGYFIEPTDKTAQVIRDLENLPGVKGVILAKSGFLKTEGNKFVKYREAVTFKTLAKKEIKAEDVQTLYLVKK